MKPQFLIKNKLTVLFLSLCLGCSAANNGEPIPGPDKQSSAALQGAVTGAGAGAVTGFQVTAGTGPGAIVGAGFGFISGAIQGASEDFAEEKMIELRQRATREERRAWAQKIIEEHFDKRLELHPTRDIFPADIFFSGDGAKLNNTGDALLETLAALNKNRAPWSRLVIATYVKSAGETNTFAEYLSKKRAIEIGDRLIKYGIEPRRIETRPVIISAPILIDPQDKPARYNQAVEIIAVDR